MWELPKNSRPVCLGGIQLCDTKIWSNMPQASLLARVPLPFASIAPQWVFSNNLDLSKFKGNVYIAFRYEGNDPSVAIGKLTTSFRLDNIMVQGN